MTGTGAFRASVLVPGSFGVCDAQQSEANQGHEEDVTPLPPFLREARSEVQGALPFLALSASQSPAREGRPAASPLSPARETEARGGVEWLSQAMQ